MGLKLVESIHKKLKGFYNILPGLIVCIITALLAKFLGGYVKSLGAGSIAIFLGMFAGNTFFGRKRYIKGAKFAEKDLLSYSIVLLGGTLTAQTIMKLGASGVSYIVVQMMITIAAVIFIGKRLKFAQDFTLLMASGNAVCGSSAIAATAPAIGADDKDKGIAVTIVNVTGTVLMLLLPLIASIVFHGDTLKTSGLIGGVLQSVGQVVASGSLVNEQVKDLATIFKIVRIIFLVFVVFGLSHYKARKAATSSETKKSKASIPWYVIGFFLMCTLFTVGIVTPQLSGVFKITSNYFEIIALAGIGMGVNFRELIKQGVKLSLYAMLIAVVQISSALILMTLLF